MKIGLFGVGHLGKIHLKCLLDSPFSLAGFYDPDDSAAKIIEEIYSIPRFLTVEKLIAAVDAVDIVCPTILHYDIALKAAMADKHVFIEKHVTETVGQAKHLMELALEHKIVMQVGHVERYNPAIIPLENKIKNPRFIEGHRLALFNPRGTDVSVVLDLMIHDLDLVLSIVKSEVSDVAANGVCIVSSTPDICNARIEFKNGCVANLTASRISLKNMRKLRIFQDDAYISLDFLTKESQMVKIDNVSEGTEMDAMTISTNTGLKRISIEQFPIGQSNAILAELNDFYHAIKNGIPPKVSIEDGFKALHLAHLIHQKIESQHE
ncbi:MAG: Gfo/Idh/MocA family oxidoreductase [Saprospiraceae bacterium]|nr:Gfo/Idh/MocA family oxidoreductase [Saprospiraceae bacterium]